MKTAIENNKLTLFTEGRIDSNNAAEVEREILAAVGANPGADIVIDAENLEYISSAGLRVLLSTHKTMSRQGGMKVIHVNDIIMEVFEVTGFSDILQIEA